MSSSANDRARGDVRQTPLVTGLFRGILVSIIIGIVVGYVQGGSSMSLKLGAK